MSQITTFSVTVSPGDGPVFSVTGNSGGAVLPDNMGNINIVGSGNITVVGTPLTNTETISFTGVLPIANGGTDTSSFAINGAVISGATTTSALSALTLADGEIVIGSSIGAPLAATLTEGTGITITNGHNSITISASSGIAWYDVTTGSATLAASSGYIADKGTLTTLTMPTNNSYGDTIRVVGKGSGGWQIVYGTGQYIIMGNASGTVTSGSLASTNANDCVEMVCTTASATAPIFTVVSSIGNILIS
jgi:hypothetical protein